MTIFVFMCHHGNIILCRKRPLSLPRFIERNKQTTTVLAVHSDTTSPCQRPVTYPAACHLVTEV